MQELRCQTDDCTRLVAKLEGGVLYIQCPRCKSWRVIPVALLVAGMATELEACRHTVTVETRLFL